VSSVVRENAAVTAERVAKLLLKFGSDRKINSGFRDPDSNKAVKGAAYSRHMYGCAVDLEDVDRKLAKWITREILVECDLYMEALNSTPTWVHLQTTPPPSGDRIFLP